MLTFLILRYHFPDGNLFLFSPFFSWGMLASPIIYCLSLHQWIGCENAVSVTSCCSSEQTREPLCFWHLDYQGTAAALCPHLHTRHCFTAAPVQQVLKHQQNRNWWHCFLHNHQHCLGKYIAFSTIASGFRFFFSSWFSCILGWLGNQIATPQKLE